MLCPPNHGRSFSIPHEVKRISCDEPTHKSLYTDGQTHGSKYFPSGLEGLPGLGFPTMSEAAGRDSQNTAEPRCDPLLQPRLPSPIQLQMNRSGCAPADLHLPRGCRSRAHHLGMTGQDGCRSPAATGAPAGGHRTASPACQGCGCHTGHTRGSRRSCSVPGCHAGPEGTQGHVTASPGTAQDPRDSSWETPEKQRNCLNVPSTHIYKYILYVYVKWLKSTCIL